MSFLLARDKGLVRIGFLLGKSKAFIGVSFWHESGQTGMQFGLVIT
jgi:hypothetical protein